jgi:hypothetical protein
VCREEAGSADCVANVDNEITEMDRRRSQIGANLGRDIEDLGSERPMTGGEPRIWDELPAHGPPPARSTPQARRCCVSLHPPPSPAVVLRRFYFDSRSVVGRLATLPPSTTAYDWA